MRWSRVIRRLCVALDEVIAVQRTVIHVPANNVVVVVVGKVVEKVVVGVVVDKAVGVVVLISSLSRTCLQIIERRVDVRRVVGGRERVEHTGAWRVDVRIVASVVVLHRRRSERRVPTVLMRVVGRV